MAFKKGHKPWNRGIHMWKGKEHPKGMKGKTPWNKGKHFSEETKRKMSLSKKEYLKTHKHPHLGKHIWKGKEHPKGMLGKHLSEETKRKMSLVRKGRVPWNRGIPHPEETRLKISQTNKGRQCYWKGKHFSKESRHKRSLAQKEYYKTHPEEKLRISQSLKGRTPWNKGKKLSEKTRKKMSESRKGEKNNNWNNGSSFEPYGLAFNKTLKEQIRKRDSYRCQQCFREESELRTKTNRPYKLIVHHIDYNKQNNHPNNLMSLCKNCHAQTNFDRNGWTAYLHKKVAEVM